MAFTKAYLLILLSLSFANVKFPQRKVECFSIYCLFQILNVIFVMFRQELTVSKE